MDHFFPNLLEEALARYDMPEDLKYLSIIESGLVPKCYQPGEGSVGLWQFVSYTV